MNKGALDAEQQVVAVSYVPLQHEIINLHDNNYSNLRNLEGVYKTVFAN